MFYYRIQLLHRNQVQHQLDLVPVWVLTQSIMHAQVLQIEYQLLPICHQSAVLM